MQLYFTFSAILRENLHIFGNGAEIQCTVVLLKQVLSGNIVISSRGVYKKPS